MWSVVFLLTALFFSIQIIRQPPRKKLYWFFAAILFFSIKILFVQSPQVSFPRLMIYILLFATCSQTKNWRAEFRKFPLRPSLLFLLLMFLIIGITDDRLSPFIKVYRPIVYFFDRFFIIFLIYLNVKSIQDMLEVYKRLFLFFLVYTIYGLLNFVTKSNPYAEIINATYGGIDTVAAYMDKSGGRIRVASFSWHAIYYGLLLDTIILMLVFYLNFIKKKTLSPIYRNSLFVLLIINLLLTNSRTPVLALIVGFGVFYLFAYSLGNKVKLVFAGFILVISGYTLFPASFAIVGNTIDTISGSGKNIAGSSVEMRQVQLAACMVVFSKSPITGNGFEFIHENLGYDTSKAKSIDDLKAGNTDKDFAGFESYLYVLLIEQGLCGIIGNIIFFFSLFMLHIREYKKVTLFGKKLVVLNLSILVAFILFIFATGDLGSFVFINAILGLNLKGIILSRNPKKAISEQPYGDGINYYNKAPIGA